MNCSIDSRFLPNRGFWGYRVIMGARVVVRDGEPIEAVLRRFKKRVEREGVAWEMRRRASYVRGTDERRAKGFRKRFKAREATFVARRASG